MFAVVPALGALLQNVIVILFRLFNEPFQADVTPDFVTLLVEREQSEQAGDATVTVAERMDAKEIQDQCGGCDRHNVLLVQRVAVKQAEFIHSGRRGLCADAAKSNDRRGARSR